MGNKQISVLLSRGALGVHPYTLYHEASPGLQLTQGCAHSSKSSHYLTVLFSIRWPREKADFFFFCSVNLPAKGWLFYIDFSSSCWWIQRAVSWILQTPSVPCLRKAWKKTHLNHFSNQKAIPLKECASYKLDLKLRKGWRPGLKGRGLVQQWLLAWSSQGKPRSINTTGTIQLTRHNKSSPACLLFKPWRISKEWNLSKLKGH